MINRPATPLTLPALPPATPLTLPALPPATSLTPPALPPATSLTPPAVPPATPPEATPDIRELHQLMKILLQKVDKIEMMLSSKADAKNCLPVGSASSIVDGDKYISENGVDLLAIKAVEADKYALALMEALFTDEELAQSCYSSTSRSTKTPLPKDKIELLEECIDRKFGKGTTQVNIQTIRRKCNQKCIDIVNKKIKKEKKQSET